MFSLSYPDAALKEPAFSQYILCKKAGLSLTGFQAIKLKGLFLIIGGSCHKYHFCHDKGYVMTKYLS